MGEKKQEKAAFARVCLIVGGVLFSIGLAWWMVLDANRPASDEANSRFKLLVDVAIIVGYALFYAGVILHARRWFADRESYYRERSLKHQSGERKQERNTNEAVLLYRTELMASLQRFMPAAWLLLLLTLVSDCIENWQQWQALPKTLSTTMPFTYIKLIGFFMLLAGAIFAWTVKRMWLIKAKVSLEFDARSKRSSASESAHSHVLQAEHAVIDKERPARMQGSPYAGLAISGGGIRSATFALGVLQGLSKEQWLQRFDYLSSVSGGGYLAGTLHALKKRSGAPDLDETVRRLDNARHGPNGVAPLAWLRRYSNYLSPSKSFGSGDSLAMLSFTARNMLLSVLQFALLGLGFCLMALALLSALVKLSEVPGNSLYWAFAIAGFSNAVFVFMQQTQANAMNLRDGVQSDALLDAMWTRTQLALLTLASVLACVGLWEFVRTDLSSPLLQDHENWHVALAVVGVFVTSACMGLFVAKWLKRLPKRAWSQSLNATLATLAGAAVGACCIYAALRGMASLDMGTEQKQLLWIIVGPVLLVLSAIVASALQVSLSSGLPDFEFALEYWARVGGRWFATVLVFWLLPSAALAFAPLMLDWLQVSIGAGLTWLLASGALLKFGFGAASDTTPAPQQGSGAMFSTKRLLLAVAPAFVSAGLFLGLCLLARWILTQLGSEYGTSISATRAQLHDAPIHMLIFAAGLCGMLWVALSAFLPIHRINLGMLYRNRLIRAYLGASNQRRKPDNATNFDMNLTHGDDLMLSELAQRPFPLLGTALNLIRPNHDQLDWQDRKAAPFVLSPLYSGYMPPPRAKHRRPVGDKDDSTNRLAKDITLGDAIAISGAAANPAMGYHSRADMALLLAIFNIRLGQWVANRCATRGTMHQKACMRFSGTYLLREAFGGVTDETDFVHLSDGGHFDNLGLFELVRRRVPRILCIDGSQDADYQFADLSATLQRCRIDLGVDISINLDALRPDEKGLNQSCFAQGEICYDDGSTGELIYLKACAMPDMPIDAQSYRQANRAFPHQSTSDQFFDEVQFEVYRTLGMHLANKLAKDPRAMKSFA